MHAEPHQGGLDDFESAAGPIDLNLQAVVNQTLTDLTIDHEASIEQALTGLTGEERASTEAALRRAHGLPPKS